MQLEIKKKENTETFETFALDPYFVWLELRRGLLSSCLHAPQWRLTASTTFPKQSVSRHPPTRNPQRLLIPTSRAS